ncbi:reverse transcriptase domain-containing protein [Streptomyces sp. IBSBF 2390]|uniref:reverse transcriptase domain-containing protein n=1 Tax=Streptomyces sp. IBSBF 2390 TaxID=2903533 RepID=UPI003FA6E874
MSNAQHAYCEGKSTETALHTIVRNLEDSIEQSDLTLVDFIDIEGAFNNVTAEAIIDSLSRKNVDQGICTWIRHMLTSRIVIGEIAGSSAVRAVSRGTPQGGVISPLL